MKTPKMNAAVCPKSGRNYKAYPWTRFCLLIAAAVFVQTAAAQNLALNPGFESGTANWYGFGSVSFSSSTALPRTGSRSGLVTGRTANWQGVAQSFIGDLQAGATYNVSAWVRLVSGGNEPVQLTFKKTDNNGTAYVNVGTGTATSSGWVLLSGTYTHSVSGLLSEMTLYVQGPAAGVSFYADDFIVSPVTTLAVGEINATVTRQTIEGFGGAIAFYVNWLVAHPYRQEIYTNIFSGLNLSILRLGNWYRYQPAINFDPDAKDIVTNATRILGRPVPIEMSSWSPPAFLKNNGTTTNGGSLIYTNGGFAYSAFADYWYDSLRAYGSNSIVPTWISIQNEPDWSASWDTCIFHATEDSGTNFASYALALDATYRRLTNMASPPKLLGPESAGIGDGTLQDYASYMDTNHFYGLAYHLYNGGSREDANTFISALQGTTNLFAGKPNFQTEYGDTDMIQTALLINHCMTYGEASAYIFWSLVWPTGGSALVEQENPWTPGSWTYPHGYRLTPQYYALKHFSYFIGAGYRRVETPGNDVNARLSAYLAQDNSRLVVVMINPNSTSYDVTLTLNGFTGTSSAVYQTVGASAEVSQFASLGSAPGNLQWSLPGYSITTVVFNSPVFAGPATNPNPVNGAVGVGTAPNLSWLSGSNAAAHLIYFGYNSNSVATATTNASEYKGSSSNTNYSPGTIASSGRYYWRVDEVAGTNVTEGATWTFATAFDPSEVIQAQGSFTVTNTFRIRFASSLGQSYRVERSDILGPPSWVTVTGGIPGTGTTIDIIDNTALPAQRFYRVVLLAP